MIYVTLGTQNKQFLRLIKEVDRLIDIGVINEEVVVQAGFTKYNSKNMKIYSEIDNKSYIKYMKDCSLLITHGGIGSMSDGIEFDKKVVVVPRLKEFGEHVNNHQLDVADEFERLGLIKKVIDINSLGNVIKSIHKFNPKQMKKDNSKMLNIITDFIENN